MSDPAPDSTAHVIPPTLRGAGALAALEGLIGLGIAVYLVIHAMTGFRESYISGYGTALWFTLIGGGVLAGGIALYTGRRWGRAIVALANILLLPVAWSLLTDSDQPLIGAPLMVVVLVTLGLTFAPRSMRYLAGDDLPPDA
ncbi:MAG: hypothetical protein QM809_08380 [Gordonia sp. (in: high G+C Gram-positive bacteria)]|uniref:hypothetical protein n=1 Tax=Gordonia sp. (in: high G+C Gram-positive bacteria) TaxID=84139 RepID=UPI0039E7128F